MMNGKDQNVEYSSNENAHDNTTFTHFDNEITQPAIPANKRNVTSSSGERKPKNLFSQTYELEEDNLGLVNKGNVRDSSRYSDLSVSYNADVTSTYALQIALKSMKERYQKLQKKISVLEEENGRLINGKSELFGEIGKMQESSIKLREKNLQLNHEVHSKHQECCSLKEQFSTISKENLKLTTELSQTSTESRKLSKEVEELIKENKLLKSNLEEILTQCRKFSINPELFSQIERIVSRSLNRGGTNAFTRTRIIPHAEDFENLDEFKTITAVDTTITAESFEWDATKDCDTLSLGACLKAKEMMRKVRDVLQKQNQELSELSPILFKVSKRKLDSSDLEDSGDQGRNYLSRLATCGSSSHPPSGIGLSSEERAMCANMLEDSGGETNVLVEEIIEESEKKVPFDWRKVEVSDDESPYTRPETRTVSTSPDLTLTFDGDANQPNQLSVDEDRTCPMCNAIFPLLLPQETFESHVLHKNSTREDTKPIKPSESTSAPTRGRNIKATPSTETNTTPHTSIFTDAPAVPPKTSRTRVSFSDCDNTRSNDATSFTDSSTSSRSEEECSDSFFTSSPSNPKKWSYKRRHSASEAAEDKKPELVQDFGSRRASTGRSDLQNEKKLMVALYDFRARTRDDLSFLKGDTLEAIQNVDCDWWLACDVTGRLGYIPANFVTEIEDVEFEPWYFGDITRNETDRLLLSPPNGHGSFLIRNSETRNMEYSLSVRCQGTVNHYRIKYSEKGWFYISPQKQFPTLKNLVEYYHLYQSGMCCKFEAPCLKLDHTESEENSCRVLDTWEIPREHIELTKKLGTGNFGEVYKGVWNKTTEIAVKTLKRGSATEREFLTEVQVMKKLRHPKLIQLYGICTDSEPLFIVTEFMKFGSLDKYLGVFKHSISLMDKLSISAQVASGMAYLESQNFIHRDLAARNVLVGSKLTCKVADFGLSRILQGDEYLAFEGTRFPIKWTAPEALFYNIFSIKSDVWSYGVLLVEVFTNGAVPYPDLTNQQVVEKINDGYRMNRPPNCPREIYALMRKCWAVDPHVRPSFDSLWQTMESFSLALYRK